MFGGTRILAWVCVLMVECRSVWFYGFGLHVDMVFIDLGRCASSLVVIFIGGGDL